jgi:membrane-bound ClpP family serine protease
MATGTGDRTVAVLLFVMGVVVLVAGILAHEPEWTSWAGVAMMLLATVMFSLGGRNV